MAIKASNLTIGSKEFEFVRYRREGKALAFPCEILRVYSKKNRVSVSFVDENGKEKKQLVCINSVRWRRDLKLQRREERLASESIHEVHKPIVCKHTNPNEVSQEPQLPISEGKQETSEKKTKKSKEKKRCNLCGREFRARNRFIRFCDVCKGRSEVYRFADTHGSSF